MIGDTGVGGRGPYYAALGVFSVVFSTLVGIPQAYKIHKLKSARGVSFLTLGLGNIGGFLYVLVSDALNP